MNTGERDAANYFEHEGWQVLRRGWPDFCLFRPGEDGKIKVKLVEIKLNRRDRLRTDQDTMHDLLRAQGLEVETFYLSDLPGEGAAYTGISTPHNYLTSLAEDAWHRCLQTGLIPAIVLKDGTARLQTSVFIEWAQDYDLDVTPRQIGSEFNSMGFKRSARYRLVPTLTEARDLWDSLRSPVKWPADGGQWDTLLE